MPLKLSDLQKEKRALAFGFLGETANLVYRPGAITPEFMGKLGTLTNAEAVVVLVAEWDILGEDGAPLPVTDAVCAILPGEFLREVVKEVIEDSAAPKASRRSSPAGSTPAAS